MGIPPHGPWALLGIAPTRQAHEIKRAYAARLKTVRPDDDPAGFQALRQAYEWALGRCGEQPAPAPAPMVHLPSQLRTRPTHSIEIQLTKSTLSALNTAPPPVVHLQAIGSQARPVHQIQATGATPPPVVRLEID